MKLTEINSYPPTVITQGQREHYYDRGYLLIPELIGEAALEALRLALDEVIQSTRDLKQSTRRIDLERNHSANNPRLRRVAYLDEFDAVFWHLCSDSVIPDIAADLLGPNVKFRELMVNFKWADGGAAVKWHQDLVFYPHTHAGTLQFLLLLDGATPEQGPLQVVPGSHKGEIYRHYDSFGRWTGAIADCDLENAGVENAIALVGPPGTVSVHHSRTIHGSAVNCSPNNRPAFVLTYSAADAMPYTSPAYPSVNYQALVRGKMPHYAHHEELSVPLPPDWSDGYTSIFDHQTKEQSF